jgi:hypothetical protein
VGGRDRETGGWEGGQLLRKSVRRGGHQPGSRGGLVQQQSRKIVPGTLICRITALRKQQCQELSICPVAAGSLEILTARSVETAENASPLARGK